MKLAQHFRHFASKLTKLCNTLFNKAFFSGITHLKFAGMKKQFWKIISCTTIPSTSVISWVKSYRKKRLQRLSVRLLKNAVIDMHTLQLSPSNCHPIMVRRERVLVLGLESPVHPQFPLLSWECYKWLFLAFVKSETSLNSHQLHKKSAWCIFLYKKNSRNLLLFGQRDVEHMLPFVKITKERPGAKQSWLLILL